MNEKDLPSPDALVPWGPQGPPEPGIWADDVLVEHEVQTLELEPDSEGPVYAALVRPTSSKTWWERARAPRTRFVALYLHGRNDYFFQSELSRKIGQMGGAFYALDLRKHGRALRPWQTIGYTDDLRVYDEEISMAVGIIRARHPDLPTVLIGHSTGGLIGTLWAWRNQSLIDGLVLNSAWLELQTLHSMRPALHAVLERVAQVRPHQTVLGTPKHDTYHRANKGGWAGSGFKTPAKLDAYPVDGAVKGWDYFEQWKRPGGYPAPAAWLEAILLGHSQVENQVRLDVPVLSMASTSGGPSLEWSPAVFTSDTVLNADLLTERAAALGANVVIRRFPGRHDLLLSDPDVREGVYAAIRGWLKFTELVP